MGSVEGHVVHKHGKLLSFLMVVVSRTYIVKYRVMHHFLQSVSIRAAVWYKCKGS